MSFFDSEDSLQFSERKPLLQEKGNEEETEEQRAARAIATRSRYEVRRAASEKQLEEVLPWHWENDTAYHVFSFGDVDSLSYLKMALRQYHLDYVFLSTWCMANADIDQITDWLERGLIGRIDFYVGEIFNARYALEYKMLLELCECFDGCRVAIFRNHAKVIGGISQRGGDGVAFVIESSANVNTNPRSEQTTITVSDDLFNWYKSIFDDIVTFDRTQRDNQKEWTPWESRN